ncbi:MAG: response regulator [Anaerolineae bacterium]|nr:response regulator [Anaerolineae bacterium]
MKRVLIVNDHEITRRVINLALTQVPDVIVIGEAENGLDAISLIEEVQPDVVVMDFLMPHMDGFEATAHITNSWPHVKVVIHSRMSLPPHVGKAMGASDVLRPYDSMKLLQTAVLNA